MAEEITNEGWEGLPEPVPEAATEDPDFSYLDSFLKDAIEKDTPTEYTVPLNAEGSFVNGVFYENYIDEAHVKVTVLEHISPVPESTICDNWEIKLTCTGEEDEVISSQILIVKTNEPAVFEFKQDVPEDHFPNEDEISPAGVGRFTLSITATVAVEMTNIKILVS